MPTVVVPFRSGKSRLALPAEARLAMSLSMLGTVLAAAKATGRTLLVSDEPAVAEQFGVEHVPDPGGGQGAAVAAGLARADPGPVLVVNADLPHATAADLELLLDGAPALVAADDGTTNALSLPEAASFRPLYGPGSAARFAELGLRALDVPNLAADVDTLADLAA